MHPEQVRQIVREEVEKALAKNPIPEPSFEGGTGGEWEPKKGDWVEVVDSTGFSPESKIKTGDIVKCVGKSRDNLFVLDGDGDLLAKASIYQIAPRKVIGYHSDRLPNTQVQEDLIQEQLKELEEKGDTHADVCAPMNLFIKPAGPLEEKPEVGSRYWLADLGGKMPDLITWDGDRFDLSAFLAGLAFPYTPEGKLGAELRAKQGIIPPLPQNHKPGFLGLVEVVGNESQHRLKGGHIGPAFDVRYDPVGYEWNGCQPEGTIIMIDKDGCSFYLHPSDYKFI